MQFNPQATVLVVSLWLLFACALPLRQLHEARRRAYQELAQLPGANPSNQAAVAAIFDHANEDLDIAAFGPCLMLSVTSIFLVRQLLRLSHSHQEMVRIPPALEHQRTSPDES